MNVPWKHPGFHCGSHLFFLSRDWKASICAQTSVNSFMSRYRLSGFFEMSCVVLPTNNSRPQYAPGQRWRVAEREGETIGERSRAVGMRRTRSSTFSLWRPPPDLRPRTRRASLATSSRAAQTRRPGARVRSSCPAPARPTLRSTDSLRRRDNTFGRGARRAALVARAAPVDASDRQLRPRFAHRSLHFGLCPAPDAQCHE